MTLDARYKQFIAFKPVPQSQIATVAAGSSGLASGGSSSAKKDDQPAAKKEEPEEKPKKKGFGLGKPRRQPRRRREEVGPDRGLGRRARARPRGRRQGRAEPGGRQRQRLEEPTSTRSERKASWRDARDGGGDRRRRPRARLRDPQPRRPRQAALRRAHRRRRPRARRGDARADARGGRSRRDPGASTTCSSPSPSSSARSPSSSTRSLADRPSARFPNIVQDAVIVVLAFLATTFVLRDTGLVAASAASAVVVGFALQDTLGNAFAGLAIQIEKPFRVGHWIRVGDHVGVVEEITWRATKLRTRAGAFVIVPNSVISKEAIVNFNEPVRPVRFSIDIGATYGRRGRTRCARRCSRRSGDRRGR